MARTSPARIEPDPAEARIQAYFAALPPKSRRVLKELRRVMLAAAPGSIEAFSYQMPGLRLDGKVLIWYAAWANHVGLYPITTAIRSAHAKALDGFETSKGTVRFPLTSPLPVALVRRLVKARIAEVRRTAR